MCLLFCWQLETWIHVFCCAYIFLVRVKNGRFTQNATVSLRSSIVQAQLASLPPLDVPKKPIGLASPTGFVKLGESAEKDAASREDLAKLSKDTSGLLKVSHKLMWKHWHCLVTWLTLSGHMTYIVWSHDHVLYVSVYVQGPKWKQVPALSCFILI